MYCFTFRDFLFRYSKSVLLSDTHSCITVNIYNLDYMYQVQSDTKKRELLKNPTKIEEIQEKKIID